MKNIFCVFNKDSNTLRVEKKLDSLIQNDVVIFENDPLSCKVFISYICTSYPDTGNNSTHLIEKQIRSIYADIEGYMKMFDIVSETINFNELISDEDWRVQ